MLATLPVDMQRSDESSPREGIPRPLEVLAAGLGLVLLSPLIALLSLAVALDSPGGILYRGQRMGRFGQPFILYKIRTMRPGEPGPQLTASGDRRVTRVGRFLRRTKLDELPSLWNVLRGDLKLVGPRPEPVPYVDLEDPLWQEVLKARPGITDPVTLRLRNEEALLAAAGRDLVTRYRRELQPYKLHGRIEYLRRRTARSDVGVLARTLAAVLFPSRAPLPSWSEVEAVARTARGEAAPLAVQGPPR